MSAMSTAVTRPTIVTRQCACGCEKTFEVPGKRPGRRYAYGHKPKAGSGAARTEQQMLAEHAAKSFTDAGKRRVLNYRMALDSAQRELDLVTAEIENVDEQMERLRMQLSNCDGFKAACVDRHAALRGTVEYLQALIDNREPKAHPLAVAVQELRGDQ